MSEREPPPPPTETILRLDGVSKVFSTGGGLFRRAGRQVHAVDDVSFEVRRGETFGIVGESGSGKTTLGRCIMRIHEPSAGTITFLPAGDEPIELTGTDRQRLRSVWRDLRMVFQDPQSSLNPRLPVIEIVGQCLRKAEGLKGRALADRVSALLLDVGLRPELLHRYAGAFSGGQRQRLGIARALATRPQLIVADEAVSALDVSIQAQTLNLLQDLQEAYRLTYVFIAHDLAVVEHICDRVAVMYLGQIVELATTAELFARPRHPYTQALLSAVPVPDPRQRRTRRIAAASALAVAGAGVQSVAALPTAPTGPADRTGCRFAPRCPLATDLCRTSAPPRKRIGEAVVLCHHAEQ